MLLNVLRENVAIVLITSVYVLAGYLVQQVYGLDGFMRLSFHHPLMDGLAILCSLVFFAAHLMLRLPYLRHSRTGYRRIVRELRERYWTGETILGFVLVYTAAAPFLTTFLSFKEGIPRIQPFVWDQTFMKWDYYLHFGHHPWMLLQPLLGRPVITRAIDLLYIFWFHLLVGFTFWMAWTGRRVLRMRFFFTFGIVWIFLGSFLATVFSSAGPCYYSKLINPENPFVSLMNYLHSLDRATALAAVQIQQRLWDAYTGAGHGYAAGISAMPSLHLAVATVFALVGYQINLWLGRALTVYCVIVQIGSVHLGWHYAIDGYAGIALACVIWRFACKVYPCPPNLNSSLG